MSETARHPSIGSAHDLADPAELERARAALRALGPSRPDAPVGIPIESPEGTGTGALEPRSLPEQPASCAASECPAFHPRQLLLDLLRDFAPLVRERRLTLTTTLHPSLPLECFGDPGPFVRAVRDAVGEALARTRQGGIAVRLLPSRTHERGLKAEVHEPSHEFEGGGGAAGIANAPPPIAGPDLAQDADGSWVRTIEYEPASSSTTAAPEAAEATEVPESFRCHARILVVEDTRVLRLVTQRQLQSFGATVTTAANGAEALHCIETGEFDLVLMDCHMPVLDGFQATRTLRERRTRGSDLVVLALTASSHADDVRHCREAGMNDVLQKPLAQAALARALARWLPDSCAGGEGHSTA